MKIDIKKIGLIIAAGIFAFSGAFGQDEPAREMTSRGGLRMQRINEIRLINEADNYVVSLTVNEGQGEIRALGTGKSGALHLKEGFIEGLRLTFEPSTASAIARKVIDTGNIRAKIAYFIPKTQQRLNDLRSEITKKLEGSGLSATVEIKGKTALVITIHDEGTGFRTGRGAETTSG